MRFIDHEKMERQGEVFPGFIQDGRETGVYIFNQTFLKQYSKNPYIRAKKLRTLRLKFSVMHRVKKNLLQPEFE